MTKGADTPSSSVHRLVWRSFIEVLAQARFPSSISSRVITTLGLVAAALISAEICSHASAPEGPKNFSTDEILADTEISTTPAAATSVSVVAKMPKSPPPATSRDVPSGFDIAVTHPNSEPLLLSGDDVSSMMLMTASSVAPPATAAAHALVSPVTPCARAPKPKLKPKPPGHEPQVVQEPQPKLSWWQRLPWLPLP
jgi:hypothetical protein